MSDWTVTATFQGAQLDPEAVSSLMETLAERECFVANVPRLNQFRVSVVSHCGSTDKCALDTHEMITSNLRPYSDAPMVAMEIVAEVEAERRANTSDLPDLVSAVEAGEILGVTRQRVHQLAEDDNFPEPLYDLGEGRTKLWLRGAIEAYGARRVTKPGRPLAEVGGK